MKKSLLLFGGLLMGLALTTVSCGSDENEDEIENGSEQKPGSGSSRIGALSSGTSLDKELPEGYRIWTVGSHKFYYDEMGRLTSIENGDGAFPFDFNKEVTYGNGMLGYKITLNSKNLITKVTFSYEKGSGIEYDRESGSATFSYNSNNQLTSYTVKSNWEQVDDGEFESGTINDNVKLTYSGKKLVKIVYDYEEIEDHKDAGTEVYTLNYDDDYDNPFYQYTPKLVTRIFGQDEFESFAFLGLFGRASSSLPTSIDYTDDYFCEMDGKEDHEEGSSACGSYTYNSYGALKSADGKFYSYTTVGTRAVSQFLPLPSQSEGKRLFARHTHHNSHKK